MTELRLDQIRTDGGTQPRYALDWSAIDDYTDEMEAGAKFPPVVVFYDGENYWLADGFHRIQAKSQTGAETIAVDLRQGTLEDAQWFSFSANKTNGLRRTNDDKQRAVKAALMHPKGAGMSDGSIAKHVGVSQQTVSAWRQKLTLTHKLCESTSRTGTDGRTINTSRIGKRPEKTDSNPPPPPNLRPQAQVRGDEETAEKHQQNRAAADESIEPSPEVKAFFGHVCELNEVMSNGGNLESMIASHPNAKRLLDEMSKAAEGLRELVTAANRWALNGIRQGLESDDADLTSTKKLLKIIEADNKRFSEKVRKMARGS